MTSKKVDSDPVIRYYSLYGKKLKSSFRLPMQELPAHDPDIIITTGRKLPKTLDHCPVPYGREWIAKADHHIVRFYDRDGHVFEFLLYKNGARITLSQSWPIWEDSVFALVNMVMGAALTLQGRSMLHACSLVDDGRSFLIMGNSGAGKSSLSITLADEGLAAHSDDVAVIHSIYFREPACEDGPYPSGESVPHQPAQPGPSSSPRPVLSSPNPVVAPGYPRIKVKPELLDTLGITGVTPIMIASVEGPEKERWLDTDQFAGGTYRDPAPLGAVFILRKRAAAASSPRVERLAPMPAAVALSSHIYGSEWFNPPGPRNLFLCTHIASSVPVYEVTLPDDLGLIRASARHLIEHHIRN